MTEAPKTREIESQEDYIQDAERSLLACIITNEGDEDLLLCIENDLQPEAFILPTASVVYEAAVFMYRDGQRDIDVVKIAKHLSETKAKNHRGYPQENSLMQSIGGFKEFSAVLEYGNNILYALRYIPIIKDAWTLRRLREIAEELKTNAMYPENRTMEEISGITLQRIKALESTGTTGAVMAFEAAKQSSERMNKAMKSDRGSMFGLSTGLKGLDTKMSGLEGGHLIAIGAGPKAGKTSLAMRFSEAVMFNEGKGVLWFSLEMTARECMDRMIAQRGLVDLKRMADNVASERHVKRYLNTLREVKDAPLAVFDDTRMNILKMASKLRSHMNKHPETKLVVVDHLMLIKPVDRKETRDNTNSEITRELKDMAKEHNVAIVLLAQRNSSERKGANKFKRPTAADIKFGGSLEADCNKLLMIWEQEDGSKSILIEYQRDGETGDVPVDFTRWCVAFHNKGEAQGIIDAADGKLMQEELI